MTHFVFKMFSVHYPTNHQTEVYIHKCSQTQVLFAKCCAFSALTLLVGHQEEHLANKEYRTGCDLSAICCTTKHRAGSNY